MHGHAGQEGHMIKRPPSGEKSFPVCRVGKKTTLKASRSVGIFFSPNFISV